MWSSTASSKSTIPVDKDDWALPVEPEILEKCKKYFDFYEPEEQLDRNYIYNICDKNNDMSIIPEYDSDSTDLIDKNCDMKWYNDLVRKWANLSLKKDDRTLFEIYKDEKIEKKMRKSILKSYLKSEKPWKIRYQKTKLHSLEMDKNQKYEELLYCYPKIICYLGWKTVSVQTILDYVNQNILLFVIDLRYGTKKNHEKTCQNIELARKKLKKTSCTLRVFSFAFIIHAHKIHCGLMYKNQDIFLDRDSIVILTCDRRWSTRGTYQIIYVNFFDYIKILQVGDIIKIGWEIKVIVNGKKESSIICTVIKDGLVKENMILELPINRILNPPPDITHEETDDLGLALNLGCDYLITSCITKKLLEYINFAAAVRNRVVVTLQSIILNKNYHTDDIDQVINFSDGFYIFSDGKNENTKIRDYIVKEALRCHKFIIRAGFLENANNMENFNHDTLKHLLLYPNGIVCPACDYDLTNLRLILKKSYPQMNYDTYYLSFGPLLNQEKTFGNAFCRCVLVCAYIYKVRFLVVINNNGKFVQLLSNHRTLVPMIASFIDSPTAQNCLLSRNVYPVICPPKAYKNWDDELTERLNSCLVYAKLMELLTKDTYFLFCYDSNACSKYCDSARILSANQYMLK